MEPRIQRRVTGRAFPACPARLLGYRREAPPDSYPFALPDPESTVVGVLLHEVDRDSLRRLDAYEDAGRLYVRRPATAEVDGRIIGCQVYVGAAVARPARRS